MSHTLRMTAAELAALTEIRAYAAAGKIIYSAHAIERARQRGASRPHIKNALVHAATCKAGDAGKWKATGPYLDGDDLTCVVAIEDGLIVVTVY